MLRLTIKNLAANRLRFAMTTFAVLLAVSFVVSSFVLTDGLRSSFNGLSGEIVGGTDFEVRPVDEFGQPDRLDRAVLDDVAAVNGVSVAAPLVMAENTLRPINAAGEQISVNGPPQLAFGWVDDVRLSRFSLIEGEAPDAPGEFTMDLDAATTNGFVVGETYDVIVPTGTARLTLTGLVSFGDDNDTLGATLMQLETQTLQDLLGVTGYDSVVVALEPGADRAAVQGELAAVQPGTEVLDNATLESEQRDDFNSQIDIISNVLLGFAGMSLFVSIFIIYNTFSIVLGQRIKELALLRIVGADPAQLRRSVLGEAAVIGVLGSAAGIAAGVGVAYGLRALFGLLGAGLPDSPVIVSARTVLVAVVLGLGVTLISAIGPARKASRVSAIAALRDGAEAGVASSRVRWSVGSVLVAVGAAAGAFGLFGASSTPSVVLMLAAGAIGIFVGVTMLSPLVAQPITRILGWPAAKTYGVSGRLANQNAGRNPQRTATTAAALMIGLAMVSMALTVGESVKAQLRATLESSVRADYIVTDEADVAGLPSTVANELDASPVTDTVSSFRYDEAMVDGEVLDVLGTDMAASSVLFDLDIVDGVGFDATVVDPVLISDNLAESSLLGVGDVVSMSFPSGAERDLTVIGIYADDIVADEDYLLDFSTWEAVGAQDADTWLAFSLTEGLSTAQADVELAPISERYPSVDIATANDFVAGIEANVDQVLAAVNVMVALAVIIALIGIANTMALSVFERTREHGLLRAVGMSRRQLRRMVRFEAALVALFGAVLGVSVGVLFAWAAVAALPETITSTLAVPTTRILVLVVVAGAAGLVAAWGPARRAGRLDVLDAING